MPEEDAPHAPVSWNRQQTRLTDAETVRRWVDGIRPDDQLVILHYRVNREGAEHYGYFTSGTVSREEAILHAKRFVTNVS